MSGFKEGKCEFLLIQISSSGVIVYPMNCLKTAHFYYMCSVVSCFNVCEGELKVESCFRKNVFPSSILTKNGRQGLEKMNVVSRKTLFRETPEGDATEVSIS